VVINIHFGAHHHRSNKGPARVLFYLVTRKGAGDNIVNLKFARSIDHGTKMRYESEKTSG
jgi:hypothetical protein